MPITVMNSGREETRGEVLGRISLLLSAWSAYLLTDNLTDEERSELSARVDEELKTFTFALLGSYPTGEELREVRG